jgi:hypothetical protein
MRLMSIRYIFSKEIEGFITKEEANLDMARTSLSYLGSKALDPELSNADLEMNLLSGRYRLLGCFASHWPALTLSYTQGKYWSKYRIYNLLTRVTLDARNYEFECDMDSSESSFQNEELQRESSEGYEMLCGAFRFHLDTRSADWNLSNSKEAST